MNKFIAKPLRRKYLDVKGYKKAPNWRIYYGSTKNLNGKFVSWVGIYKKNKIVERYIREHRKRKDCIARFWRLVNKREEYIKKLKMTKIERALFYGE